MKPAGVKFYVQLHNDNDAGSHAFGVGGKAIGATQACRHHEHVSVATRARNDKCLARHKPNRLRILFPKRYEPHHSSSISILIQWWGHYQ